VAGHAANFCQRGRLRFKSNKKWGLAKMGNRGVPFLKLVGGERSASLPVDFEIKRR